METQEWLATIGNNWTAIELIWTIGAVCTLWLSSRAVGRNKRVVSRAEYKNISGYLYTWVTRNLRKARTIRNRQVVWVLLGLVSMTLPSGRSFDPDVAKYYYYAGILAGLMIVYLEIQDIYELSVEEWEWREVRKQMLAESDSAGNVTLPIKSFTEDNDDDADDAD